MFVIVGAGVSGLYTAYTLLKDDPKREILILGEYLPGDQSTNYTSPWAGGNFSGITASDPNSLAWDKYSFTHFAELYEDLGPDSGLEKRPVTEFYEFQPDPRKIESLKTFATNFRVLEKSELVDSDVVFGITYETWNFNCPKFLVRFAEKLTAKWGVKFERRKLTHLSQAWISSDVEGVFNCTGLGAKTLGGVDDTKMYPSRGQVVVVRAPHVNGNYMRWGKTAVTYIIPRPQSNGSVVLGGFLQKDNWSGSTYREQSVDILQRTTKLRPELKGCEVIREAAGLRPSRYGGPRIEKELFGDGQYVVHNYGASGFGYQSGLGMARTAVDLLRIDSKL